MKVSFVLYSRLFSKTRQCFKFKIWKTENGKPDIVWKTVKRVNSKRTPIIILILKSLKLGIAVLVMFNKMLVIVLIIDFYSVYGPGSKNPVFQFVPISITQCKKWAKF